ncbi:MAG: type III pantothenate kinase [Myxococcota bacterium]
MLLTIDVGNTNTVLGLMKGTSLEARVRIRTVERTTDELGVLLLQAFGQRGITPDDVTGAIIGSVVPSVLYSFDKACRRYFGVELMVVGKGLRTGIRVQTDNPREVGADRIVNSVAAIRRWGGPIVVVDFGTATTFDCVNTDNAYVGGAIAPGFGISEQALFTATAKLPRVEVRRPPRAIGTNTVHAIQSGLYYGYAGLVDALARRCADELAPGAKVVATGGLAQLMAEPSTVIEEVDPFLTLRGLAHIYALNSGA